MTTYRCTKCNNELEVKAYPGLHKGEMEAEVEPCKPCFEELEDRIDDLEIELSECENLL